MIWILGGTLDARDLVDRLDDFSNLLVTVVSKEAKDLLPKELDVRVGALDKEAMEKFVIDEKIDLILDLTHPFAKEVSQNVKEVAKKKDIQLIRFVRESFKTDPFVEYVNSYQEAASLLENTEGNVLFTIGANKIEDFIPYKKNQRFIYRVLPTLDSLQKLYDQGVSMKDIVAMMGPFSEDLNISLIKTFDIAITISKEGGPGSGFEDKIKACKKTNTRLIAIKQDEKEGNYSLEDIVKIIKGK